MSLESQPNQERVIKALSRETDPITFKQGPEKVPKPNITNEVLHEAYDAMKVAEEEFKSLFLAAREAEAARQPEKKVQELYDVAYSYRDRELADAKKAYDELWETPKAE
jgi:hypothetical protein